MYDGDSFLTLSGLGRVGLVLVSLTLAAMMAWLVIRVGRGRPLVVRLCVAFTAFWAFVWLSPQVYYFYYLTLFEGLPLQNVIQSPPSPIEMLSLLTFTEMFNLSNHSKGVLGWVLIALGYWGGGRRDTV